MSNAHEPTHARNAYGLYCLAAPLSAPVAAPVRACRCSACAEEHCAAVCSRVFYCAAVLVLFGFLALSA